MNARVSEVCFAVSKSAGAPWMQKAEKTLVFVQQFIKGGLTKLCNVINFMAYGAQLIATQGIISMKNSQRKMYVPSYERTRTRTVQVGTRTLVEYVRASIVWEFS